MRIATQLRIISGLTISTMLILAPVLIWSFVAFKIEKNDYALTDAIKINLFERVSLRDQYLLYREDRMRMQWDTSKKAAENLLGQVRERFNNVQEQEMLRQMRRNLRETGDVFQRIVKNTETLKSAGETHPVYEELDKRLVSQLLLKASAFRDMAVRLQDGSTRRVERSYRHLTVIIGLFSVTLAFATIWSATHLARLIGRRLPPLHDGARIVADGNFAFRIAPLGSDEFSELAQAINAMTEKLQAATSRLEVEIGAQKKTAEMLHKLSIAVEQSPASVVITDPAANIEYVNGRFSEISGYGAVEVLGKNARIFKSGHTAKAVYQALWDKLGSGQGWRGELLNRKKNGELYWEEIQIAPVIDPDGRVTHFVAVKTDIDVRKLAEGLLRQSEARMRAILDNTPYLIWLKNTEGRFIAVNNAFFRTTGLPSMQDVLGKTDFDLWPQDAANKFRADDADVMSTRKQKLTGESLTVNGQTRWFETFKAPIMDANGVLLGTTGFAQDITVRRDAEEKVKHLAHYDPLTNLPNRTLFGDRLQHALAMARRDQTRLAVMFVDLDKFKPVNDQYGHQMGDLLLKESALRMQESLRESDTVARQGGDEFIMLLLNIETEQDAMLVAEKIRLALSREFFLLGQRLEISSSIGIAVCPEHGEDAEQLVRHADLAMYHAKEDGRNRATLYRADMGER